MTSLSRRKRLTTARPTTPTRTIASLFCLGWLTAGALSADPPASLRPLTSPAAPADRHELAPLMPTAKPGSLAAPRTLLYQKDAIPQAKPFALPDLGPLPVVHQEQLNPPDQEAAQPGEDAVITLFRQSLQTAPPQLSGIGLKAEETVRLEFQQQIEKIAPQQMPTFGVFPIGIAKDVETIDKVTRVKATYDVTSAGYRISQQAYTSRTFPPATERVAPAFVCYDRLYFQDLNAERYGWELGPLQPLVSAGLFYKDALFLPYHIGTQPCRCYECSAGYCLPGDPVPYLLYPPELSLSGFLLEAGTVVGLAAIFP